MITTTITAVATTTTVLACFFFVCFFRTTKTVVVSAAGSSSGGRHKWFQNKWNEMIDDGPLIPATKHTMPELDEPSPPLFVVGTNEGQVFTIDSSDGSIVAGFSTGPPLLIIDDNVYDNETTNNDHDNDDDDDVNEKPKYNNHVPADSGLSKSQIVPSWDGILYWRQPIASSSSSSDSRSSQDNNDDDDDKTKLVPIASIRDLVDNPIQMCEETDGTNCAILTATSLGPSLFSLNPQGSLNWARTRTSASSDATAAATMPNYDGTRNDDEDVDSDRDDDMNDEDLPPSDDKNKSTSKKSLLLQRQDYLVEQISTQTGEQVWNLTWGSLEALDFMGQPHEDDYSNSFADNLPEDPHRRYPQQTKTPPFPSLIFSNHGMSLVALLSQPPKFLWKRDFPSVVTIVLGMEGGSWQSLNLISEGEAADSVDGGDLKSQKRPPKPYLSPEQRHLYPGNEHHHHQHHYEQKRLPAYEQEEDKWYWWWTGNSGLGKKNPTALDFELDDSADSNGLVFVPRPGPQALARNSWFLSHFFQSPQSKGEQSFQGYLDEAANKPVEQHQQHLLQQLQTKRQGYSWPPRDDDPYDTTSFPRLLLLPPPDQSLPQNAGGVFLSWRVVTGLVSVFVGSLGAAYLLYKKKKEKWLSHSNGVASNLSSNGGSVATTTETSNTSTTPKLKRKRSGSHDDALERSDDMLLQHSVHNFGIPPLGRISNEFPPSFPGTNSTLQRSASAPEIAHSSLSVEDSATLSPIVERQTQQSNDAVELPRLKQEELVRLQSAPVNTQQQSTSQGGVGMIDGIPLIRYSRYQSEFKEVEPLGKGGFGTVFRCTNVLDGREYAVKKVSIRSYGDSDSPGTEAFSQELHRVLREVKFLALLDDPHIVRYYTAWLEMIEDEHVDAAGVNSSSGTNLSRRFSSELLTSMDPSFTASNIDTDVSYSHSMYSRRPSKRGNKKRSTNPMKWTANNPLGWNNNLDQWESSFQRGGHNLLSPDVEDCGFIFEESSEEEEEEEKEPSSSLVESATKEKRDKDNDNKKCTVDSMHVSNQSSKSSSHNTTINKKTLSFADDVVNDTNGKSSTLPKDKPKTKSVRHILYIQMQLCSSKTLADFLSNPEARKAGRAAAVDIPHALRLFHQIVQAVKHVHEQGLIHRDLKPSNCFIDENGIVKVGDFGLSRESGDNTNTDQMDSAVVLDEGPQEDMLGGDNTVGVGTRSYASPVRLRFCFC